MSIRKSFYTGALILATIPGVVRAQNAPDAPPPPPPDQGQPNGPQMPDPRNAIPACVLDLGDSVGRMPPQAVAPQVMMALKKFSFGDFQLEKNDVFFPLQSGDLIVLHKNEMTIRGNNGTTLDASQKAFFANIAVDARNECKQEKYQQEMQMQEDFFRYGWPASVGGNGVFYLPMFYDEGTWGYGFGGGTNITIVTKTVINNWKHNKNPHPLPSPHPIHPHPHPLEQGTGASQINAAPPVNQPASTPATRIALHEQGGRGIVAFPHTQPGAVSGLQGFTPAHVAGGQGPVTSGARPIVSFPHSPTQTGQQNGYRAPNSVTGNRSPRVIGTPRGVAGGQPSRPVARSAPSGNAHHK